MTLHVDLPPTGMRYEFAEADYRILRDLITIARRMARTAEAGDPHGFAGLLATLDRLDRIADLATIVKGEDDGK